MPRPRPRTSKPHVLVVDPHGDSRDLIREILEYSGFRVSEAASAEDAASLAVVLAFDVVITDAALGGSPQDGVWLLARVQRQAEPPAVIALTGAPDRAADLARHDFAMVIIKPVDVMGLATAVRSVLEQNRRPRSGSRDAPYPPRSRQRSQSGWTR